MPPDADLCFWRRALPTLRWIYRRAYTRAYAALRGVRVGPGTIIRPGASLSREGGGSITLGAKCVVHPGAKILTYGGDVELGSRCSVNPYAVLYGHGGLRIGDYVRIASHCVVIPSNHGFDDTQRPIAEQPETRRGIMIGDDVWLGAQVVVLDGSVLEDGCVVGAGAVVRGRLEARMVYAGVPAKPLKRRSQVSN